VYKINLIFGFQGNTNVDNPLLWFKTF